MTFFPLLGAMGAFLFALGESFTSVLFGRILIGAGMAPVLMGAMKVFTLRFRPEKFATLVGINISIGTAGNIFATSPLAYLASTIGWRMTFVIAGGITVLLALKFNVEWYVSYRQEFRKQLMRYVRYTARFLSRKRCCIYHHIFIF
jgi:MFS family permease